MEENELNEAIYNAVIDTLKSHVNELRPQPKSISIKILSAGAVPGKDDEIKVAFQAVIESEINLGFGE